jgi:hypothetical protein
MSVKLLYYSKDKGKSWKSKMINIPEKSLDCIGVSERKIFITTRNGVWTSKIENIIEM